MRCIECDEKEALDLSSFCKDCKTKKDIEWNTCKHCGAKYKEDTSNYVINSCCRKCNDEIDKKRDFESAKENGSVTRDDSIMCPYCGDVVEDDLGEYRDNDSFSCPECDKDSDLSIEYTTHFTTSKKET